MASIAQHLTAQPSVLYRKNRLFYMAYDLPWLAGILATIGVMVAVGWPGLIPAVAPQWEPWMWALLPATFYVHVLMNVTVHNCCHGNLPRSINRLVGEVFGVLVLTRYASWEIIHQRHHRYSDDPERDPHHVLPNFWVFLARTMLINVESQLQQIQYDQFGDTPGHRRYEKLRAVVSFGTMVVLLAAYFMFLGPDLFLRIFVPTQALGWLVVAHFNWATHNAHDPNGDYHPVNLDHGLYWIGNRIWFGLYMHGNHHKRANVFNPLRMEQVLARRAAARAARGQGPELDPDDEHADRPAA